MKPIREKFLVYGSPSIEQPEIDEVVKCLESRWLGTGPRVSQFEQAFCEYKNGWGHPVAVNSCTAALHLSMLAAGLKPGDEVITTAMTFCATVNAIIHAGCKPVLADVEPSSQNISPDSIRKHITPQTRAIIPVHFAGRACDMEAICAIAKEHNLKIIEDCAHAIETEHHGKQAGTFGDFACFSFYVTKNVVTGEGGMILAKDEADANRLKTLALHGMSKDAWKRFSDDGYKHYEVVECGYKYNMMDLQAAIGIHQLASVEDNWQRRQEIWNRYEAELADLPLSLPHPIEPNTRHAYHLYTLMIEEAKSGISRDQFLVAMQKQNIGCGVHYRCIAEHPYYQTTFGWSPEDVPVATAIGNQTVSIPLSPALTDDDLQDVIGSIRNVFS